MAKTLSIILGLIAALLIAGCGSGSQPSAVSPSQEPEVSTEAEETTYQSEEENEAEVGGPLANVGTITAFPEKGQAFINHYHVGPLLYASDGTPPEEVLAACGLETSTQTASAVFARGEVAITYSQGTLPASFADIGGYDGGVITSDGGQGVLAVNMEGTWYCGGSTPSFELEPGESQTFPIWVIVLQALTNSQPRVPASKLNGWYFMPVTPSSNGFRPIIKGPGAGICEGEWGEVEHLFLYNRSGSSNTCQP